MNKVSSSKGFTGVGLLSAFAASLCCITPIIALLAGSSSIAANFYWIEPARPYLIALSVAVLVFAWYVKLKPEAEGDCCEINQKPSFLQSKTFLSIVTVFAGLMITFPLYAKIFYPKSVIRSALVSPINNNIKVKFNIVGMTCEACEAHVDNELSKFAAVSQVTTSYVAKSSIVIFDSSKINVKTVEAAINTTGYTVKSFKIINSK